MVGTREPSDLGRRRTQRWVREPVSKGTMVVSGLARGVHTLAHGTALERGGPTIAVLGMGLGRCSPPENQALFDEIRSRHLALSQFPPGPPPWAFGRPPEVPRRDAVPNSASAPCQALGDGTLQSELAPEPVHLDLPFGPVRDEQEVEAERGLQAGEGVGGAVEGGPVHRGGTAGGEPHVQPTAGQGEAEPVWPGHDGQAQGRVERRPRTEGHPGELVQAADRLQRGEPGPASALPLRRVGQAAPQRGGEAAPTSSERMTSPRNHRTR